MANTEPTTTRLPHGGVLGGPVRWSEPQPTAGTAAVNGFVLPVGTVTLLLGDIEGSVRLWEAQPEAMAAAIVHFGELVADRVGLHDGVRPIEQGEGDSFVAAFARATDAIACALDLQRSIATREWSGGVRLSVRMAVHTGEAQKRDEGNYIGKAINRCARLRALAHGSQTLVSAAARDLVAEALPAGASLADLGLRRLRDIAHPEQVFQLNHPDLPSEFPPLRSLDELPNNLPVRLSEFIGRSGELAEVSDLLRSHRLVTLTGSGGAGKTRLAIQVAADTAERYPDGVWFADLSQATQPAHVPQEVASAVRVGEQPGRAVNDIVVEHLRARDALVILDNCEQVIDAVARWADEALRACPHLTVLATSRERIGIEGETPWRVPPLSLPSTERAPIEALATSDAVQLFVDRARQAASRFALTEDNAATVAELCRRLDGIPLAIELAAARTRVLSPRQILDGIHDRFRLLTGSARTAMPRHQTLRASVDWSHALLGEPEQVLLRRLGVFAGSFDLSVAETVCVGTPIEAHHVLDLLTLLVDKSLVAVDDGREPARYRLTETIRQYALDRLADAREEEQYRERHLDYCISEAERIRRARSQDSLVMSRRNFAAAFEWATSTGRNDAALKLAGQMTYLQRYDESKRMLEVALSVATDPLLRIRPLMGLANMAATQGDPERMLSASREALALAEAKGDTAAARSARSLLVVAAGNLGDESALAEAEAAMERAHARPPEFLLVKAIRARWRGDTRTAHDLLEQLVAMRRAGQSGWGLSFLLPALASAKAALGDVPGAEAVAKEAVGEATTPYMRAQALARLAEIEQATGKSEAAQGAIDEGTSLLEAAGGVHIRFEALAAQRAEAAGDFRQARAILQRTLSARPDLARRGPNLVELARLDALAGDIETARANLAKGLELGGVTQRHLAVVRGWIELMDGAYAEAEEYAHEAMAAAGPKTPAPLTIAAFAALGLECWEEAIRLTAAANALAQRGGNTFDLRQTSGRRLIEAARAAVGDDQFQELWTEGAAMDIDQAYAYALRGRGERKRPSAGWASLTPTEEEVVKLVAQGLTNAEVAKRLFVSTNTVRTHVSHVFTKLGVKTRAELAAAATSRSSTANA